MNKITELEKIGTKICNSPLDTECSNFGVFKEELCEECKSELDCFHDTIFNSSGKDLSYSELSKHFVSLPEDFKNIALIWGLCDTVFKDKVYLLYSTKNKG